MSNLLISILSPWLVTILLIIVFLIGIYYIPFLLREFKKMPKIVIVLFLIFVAVGAYIRFVHVPQIHRIYYDEDRYLGYAVSWARFFKATNIDIATPDKLIKGKPDPAARVTVPTINGWALKILGFSEDSTFTIAKVFSVIQIVLLFILAQLIFRNYRTSLFATGAIAFLPTIVYWSVSTNLDLYFVNFAILALIGGLAYAYHPEKLVNKIFLVASVMLLLFVRLEAFLFLLVIASTIVAIRHTSKKKHFSKDDLYLGLIFIPLILFRTIISLSVFGQTWCCGESTPLESFYPAYFVRHIIPNLQDFFINPEFPFIITILAAIALFGKRDIKVLILGVWVFLYFLLYSSYYAGRFFDYQFSGSYGRFFLMLIPPLIILAGVAFDDTLRYIMSQKYAKRIGLLLLAIIGLLVILYPTIKNYQTLIKTSRYAHIVEDSAISFHEKSEKDLIYKVEKDAVILHSLSAVVLLSGRTALYLSELTDKGEGFDFVLKSLREGKPVYSLPLYFCEAQPEKCEKINHYFVMKPIKSDSKNPLLNYVKIELSERAY